jgi:nucleoside-diphosphate-sugar epimerase
VRIFLIGTGYVGMTLLSSWKNLGDSFFATTTSESKVEEIRSKRVVENPILLKINKNTDLTPDLELCDVLVITIAPKEGDGYRETYLDTALCLSRALKRRTKPLFLLYTSSTSVYGNHGGGVVDETSDRNPLSESGKTLSEVEDVFLSCANPKIEVCILRLGGIYGPLRTHEQRARKISPKKMNGSGQEPTNHIHLEDITSAIEFCVINRLSGVYNLVNDDHPNRELFYNDICAQIEIHPPAWPLSRSPSLATNAFVSNEKIKKIGFCFKYPHLSKKKRG